MNLQWSRQSIVGSGISYYPIEFQSILLWGLVTSIKDEDGAAETSSLDIMRSDYNNLKELQVHIYYNNASTTGKSMYTNYVVAGV